jgi:acetyl esterase
MPDPASDNPLMQLFQAKPPESALELREMLASMIGLLNTDLPEVGAFHDEVVVREVDGTKVTADVVVPTGAGPHPVLVYLHGGGWVAGSPKTHNKLAHRFAEGGFLVFNVDYRLGPEHEFPAAFDDCVDAIRWAARVAPEYGGDPTRIAVGGDSAGGNLTAAAVAALADESDAPNVGAVLLIYGAFDFAQLGAGDTSGVSAEQAERMTELMVAGYLGSDERERKLRDPRVSPIHIAEKLPPAHIVCGTADPLIEHAQAIAERLDAAGIPFERRDIEGMPHGFVQMEFLPAARESIDHMLEFMRKHL